MNIIFIDEQDYSSKENKKIYKIIYSLFGFYIIKYKISKEACIFKIIVNKEKLNKFAYNIFINKICKKEVVSYFVPSKKCNDCYFLFKEDGNDFIVTKQNNLNLNDIKYIKNYADKNNIPRKNIKILMIIDKLGNFEKDKLMYFISKFKVVNIYLTDSKNINNVKSTIEKINENEGSTIEIVSKLKLKEYNVLLVFSNNFKMENVTDSLFILDYNNSDLDVYSNAYKMYERNKSEINNIFKSINLDISKFEKTKIGKLYMHIGRLPLDK